VGLLDDYETLTKIRILGGNGGTKRVEVGAAISVEYLGLAQHTNIHFRTPQLIREQQLKSIVNSQMQTAVSDAQAKASRKKDA
jgi:hypothetical protein